METLFELWAYFQDENNRQIISFLAGGIIIGITWAAWVVRRILVYRDARNKVEKERPQFEFQEGDLAHYRPDLLKKHIYSKYNYSVTNGEPNLGYMVIVYGGYETHRETAADMDLVVLIDKHQDNPDDLPEYRVKFDPDGFVTITEYHFLKFLRNLILGKPHAISVMLDGRLLDCNGMNSLEFDYLKSLTKDLCYHPNYISDVIRLEINAYDYLRSVAEKENEQELLSSFICLESTCYVQRLMLKDMETIVNCDAIYPLSKPEVLAEKLLRRDTDLAKQYIEFRNRQKGRAAIPPLNIMQAEFSEFKNRIESLIG